MASGGCFSTNWLRTRSSGWLLAGFCQSRQAHGLLKPGTKGLHSLVTSVAGNSLKAGGSCDVAQFLLEHRPARRVQGPPAALPPSASRPLCSLNS